MYRQAYYDTISEVKRQFDKLFANGTVDPWLSGTHLSGTSITND